MNPPFRDRREAGQRLARLLSPYGRTADAIAEWKKIKTGRWAWKAAAELSRDGPFVRGFEVYENLPEEAFKWYLDLRKYGSVPHAGFGMGIERAVSWICGLEHVRETIPFARMLHRLYP